jgi:hypothetical protein
MGRFEVQTEVFSQKETVECLKRAIELTGNRNMADQKGSNSG